MGQGLTRIFFGKSSINSTRPVLIFWNSILGVSKKRVGGSGELYPKDCFWICVTLQSPLGRHPSRARHAHGASLFTESNVRSIQVML